MPLNEQINQLNEKIDTAEQEVADLEEQSEAVNNVSNKIEEIINSATLRSVLVKTSHYTHTCNDFSTRVDEFQTALDNDDDAWQDLASEILAAEVEPCTSDDVKKLKVQKEKAQVHVATIQEKIKVKREEIASLKEQLHIALSKTTTTTPSLKTSTILKPSTNITSTSRLSSIHTI